MPLVAHAINIQKQDIGHRPVRQQRLGAVVFPQFQIVYAVFSDVPPDIFNQPLPV